MTSLILSLLFVVIVVFSALVGFARGLNKTVIRLITFALAVAATFFVSGAITNLIADLALIEGKTLGQFVLGNLNQMEMLARIFASAPLLEEAVLTVPSFAIGLVLFPVVFVLLNFISWILFLVLSKPLRKLIFREDVKAKKKIGAGKRFAGFGVGVVTGALVFAMLMAPLFGFLSVLPERSALEKVVDALDEQGALSEDFAEIIKGELSLLESPVYTVSSVLGVTPVGKAYLASVSKIERDGEVTYLTDEFTTIFAVAQTAIEAEFIAALKEQNAIYGILADEAFMNELIADMFDSKLLRSAIPEVTAIALESTARMLGVPENKEAVYENMMGDIAAIVKESDVDFDAIEAYEKFHGISFIDDVYAEARTKIMTEDEYNEEKEKLEKLESKIAKVFNKTLSESNDAIAKGIAKSFVTIIQEQVKAEGVDSLKNFSATQVQDKIEKIDIVDVAVEGATKSDIADMLDKIQKPEKFETKVATIETITENIRNTVKEAVKDDSKTQETSTTLASVVCNFAGAVSVAADANGNIDPMKLDFQKIGNAVGTLQGSTLNGVGSAVLDIVVSGDFGDNDMISSAVGGIKDAYNEGKPVADTVKTAGDIVKLVDAMNKSEGETTADLTSSFENLVKGLTEATLDMLPDILTDDVLVSFGVPEKHTDSSYEVIDILFRELVDLQGEAYYDKEVEAVLSLYNLFSKANNSLKDEDLEEFADHAIDSQAIFNTLNKVSGSNPFGIKISSQSERDRIADSLEKYYAEDKAVEADKQRVYDVYTDMARFIGIENEVTFEK